ncbi:MAG: GTPase Era [Limnochordales bacterium]|nr:GTPase Era [Bacillota bacterium]
MSEKPFRSGYVALIGRPNVGKSTLVNALVGEKVAIVSDKPQTTRHRIRGVLTRPDAQIVFVDTPGLHKPRHLLGEYMAKAAQGAIPDVDIVLFVVDGAEGPRARDRWIAERLARVDKPIILVVNKLDAFGTVPPAEDEEGAPERPEPSPEELQELTARFGDERTARCVAPFLSLGSFEHVAPVSAVTGEGLDALVEALIARLPEGPKYYPDDWITDAPEQFMVAELIREQVLHNTEDEVPHSVAVVVEEMKRRPDRDLIDIRATIVVDRESQKGIIIGKQGSMLKRIGQAARMEIERLLGSQVHLDLWVKAKPGWRDRAGSLQELGFR